MHMPFLGVPKFVNFQCEAPNDGVESRDCRQVSTAEPSSGLTLPAWEGGREAGVSAKPLSLEPKRATRIGWVHAWDVEAG